MPSHHDLILSAAAAVWKMKVKPHIDGSGHGATKGGFIRPSQHYTFSELGIMNSKFALVLVLLTLLETATATSDHGMVSLTQFDKII